jgi:hypothetical protein
VLDLVEEAFDEVARFVEISAEADWILAVRFSPPYSSVDDFEARERSIKL